MKTTIHSADSPWNSAAGAAPGMRRLAAVLVLLPAAMLLAAGCGATQLMPTPNLYSRTPDNPFDDVPPCFRTSTVDLIYATDRVPEGDPAAGPRYGFRRSKSLAFGVTTVRIGRDVSWDDLVAASRSARRRVDLAMSTVKTREAARFNTVRPATVERNGEMVESPEAAAARLEVEGRFKALVAARLALTPKKEVYVFIHGVGSTFDAASHIMAGLWHFMGRRGLPIVYTWPAGGGGDPLRGYTYDRESSEFTIFHLKQFLRLVASCPDVRKVHILAHSRGTDVAVTALRELNIENRAAGGDTRKALKLGCLVLAAADLDVEVSSQRIGAERLMRVPEQMVLYVSPTDAMLGMADWLFGSTDRLGELDASDLSPGMARVIQRRPEIEIIDGRVAGSGFGSHDYFYQHPAVSSDLILLLRDNRLPGAANGRPLIPDPGGTWRIDKDYPASCGSDRAPDAAR